MKKLVLTITLLCGLTLLATQTLQAAPTQPTSSLKWQTISAMAAEAEAAGQYDAALAWLAEEGPVRSPLAEADDVPALLVLSQAWAARGDQRIEQGEQEAGLGDLAAVLRQGAAIERHAQTTAARRIGAEIQQLSLDLLDLVALEDLSGAQQAALLMVLGEAAVIPSPEETIDRQCAAEAARPETTWWQWDDRDDGDCTDEQLGALTALLEENTEKRGALRAVLR
jgi:hypothetical protein